MNPTSRRHFFGQIAASALAAGAFLGNSLLWAAAIRKMKMNLVCGSIGVKADQVRSADLAARFGFEAVEPDVTFLAKLSNAELNRLLDDLKSKNLVWGSANFPVEFRQGEEAFNAGMKQLPQFARTCHGAGITRVGTWIAPAHPTLTYLQNFKQHVARLRAGASVLADSNLRLGLEYVGPKTSWTAGRFPFIHTMVEMKELIAEINKPNMGFVLDSWHWYTAGETKADLLTLANKDIVSVDLNDAPAGIAVDQQKDLSRELPLATGVTDVATFLNALNQLGYDGPVRVEPFNARLNALPAEEAVAEASKAIHKAFALIQ